MLELFTLTQYCKILITKQERGCAIVVTEFPKIVKIQKKLCKIWEEVRKSLSEHTKNAVYDKTSTYLFSLAYLVHVEIHNFKSLFKSWK